MGEVEDVDKNPDIRSDILTICLGSLIFVVSSTLRNLWYFSVSQNIQQVNNLITNFLF